jgi:hypothetical protein
LATVAEVQKARLDVAKLKFLLLSLICLSAICVSSGCIKIDFGPPMSDECQGFYKDRNGHTEAFKQYDLDKQLRIYRCGLHREPPDIALGSDIARRGEPAIPILLQKLETATDDETKYEIVDVFWSMSNMGYLRNKSEVVPRIRAVVSRMAQPYWKKEAEIELEKIEKSD